MFPSPWEIILSYILRLFAPVVTAITDRIDTLELNLMSAVSDLARAMDEDTNRIAAKIEALTERVAAGDTTAAAELAPLAARLRSLGADPSDPIPTDPTEEPTPTDPEVQ